MTVAKRSGSPEKAGSFRGTSNSINFNDSFNDRDDLGFANLNQ